MMTRTSTGTTLLVVPLDKNSKRIVTAKKVVQKYLAKLYRKIVMTYHPHFLTDGQDLLITHLSDSYESILL